MTTSRISVIVPTLVRPAIVERFIDSLNQQTLLPVELIIVDASLESSERQFRQRLDQRMRLTYQRSKPGLTRQRNLGIRQAIGDIVFFFDDDIVLEPRYLSNCIEVFNRPGNEKVGVVYGTITNLGQPSRSIVLRLHAAISRMTARVFFLARNGSGNFQKSGMPTSVIGQTKEISCQCMPGGLTAYRREVFSDFQFDESLSQYSYMEDDDAGIRISKQYRILYTPTARCEHRHATSSRIGEYEAGKMMIINHHYLFRKNFPRSASYRFAHFLSLLGYPIFQLWNLQWRRALGGVAGLISVCLQRDPLSKNGFHEQASHTS